MSISKKEQFTIFKKGLEIASKLSVEDSNLDLKSRGIDDYVSYEERSKTANFHNGQNNTTGRFKMGGLFYCLEEHYIGNCNTNIKYDILPSHKKFIEYQSYEAYDRLSVKEKEIFSALQIVLMK